MPERNYRFEIHGTAGNGQTWKTNGTVTDGDNDFMAVVDDAMRLSFNQLTGGKAVYGKPGVGCVGPYELQRIVIEKY